MLDLYRSTSHFLRIFQS